MQARDRKIRAHGHFEGRPGAPDAHVSRLALLLLNISDKRPDAVLLIRDNDGDERRRKGLEQARTESKLSVPIVIGVARTKRECWVLAGFDPQDSAEREKLTELRSQLGFDPTLFAEKLTAKTDRAKRSAKRVLAELTGGNQQREAACWLETDLITLHGRGHKSGLASYLREVRNDLAPLFTRAPQ